MSRARVVDTSVLVAAAAPEDTHHRQAMEWMAEPGPAVVPNEALVETLGFVKKRLSRRAAEELLEALRSTEGVELGHESDLLAAFDVQAKHPGLSIVDAVGVAMAWRLRCDLDTFDEGQRKAWRTGTGAGGRRP